MTINGALSFARIFHAAGDIASQESGQLDQLAQLSKSFPIAENNRSWQKLAWISISAQLWFIVNNRFLFPIVKSLPKKKREIFMSNNTPPTRTLLSDLKTKDDILCQNGKNKNNRSLVRHQ